MKTPRFRLITILIFFGSVLWATAKTPNPPNVIIIYADDVGYGDLGCYGAEAVDTPEIDSLARNGIRFTSAYATASTCTPSRYSLLTGRYPFRNEEAVILPGNAPLIIDVEKPNLPKAFQNKGYTTGLVGKWHIGLGAQGVPLDWNGTISPGPREVGFDYSFHMAATGDRVPSVYIENGHVVNLDPADPIEVNYEEPIGNDPTGITHPHLLKVQADEQHAKTIVDGVSRIGWMSGGQAARWKDEAMSDTFLSKAIGFIESNRNQPFFLYYATQENHVPRVPHPRFAGSSSLGPRGDALAQMDWNVGQIVKTLKDLHLLENTLIIFSSDNGPVLFDGYWDGAIEKNGDHRPAGPFAGGKYSSNEGGTRMPFIVSWKGKIDPNLSDALVSQVDIYASLCALIGATPDPESDSENLLDTLFGKRSTGRESLIQQGVGNKAIRRGNWKYIPPGVITNRGKKGFFDRIEVSEPGLLFYLQEDPMEQHDLVSVYPEVVQSLRAELEQTLGKKMSSVSSSVELGGAVDKQ